MQCPQCQAEMTQSKVGWLCPNCGHLATGGSTSDSATSPAAGLNPEAAAPPESNAPPSTETNKTESHSKRLETVSQSASTPPASTGEQATHPAQGSAPSAKTSVYHRRRWPRLILIVLAVIASLAVLGYGYVVAARRPYQQFQAKLQAAKTLSFNGTLKFSASGFLSSFGSDLTFKGRYDGRNPAGPAGDLNFNGTWASQKYDGQAMLNDGSVFFKLTGPILPVIRYNQSSFLYPITPVWYKTKIDNSLYGNYCETRPDTNYPNNLELYRLLKSIKTKNSPFVNLIASLNGQSATSYHGTVDSAQLPELLKQINAQLPEGCGLQYYSPPADPKKLTITYNLVTSPSADRFKLIFDDKSVGAKIDFTINLHDYNQPFSITLPSDAIDLNATRQAQTDLLNRDHTRKSDLDKLKVALEAYAATNKKLYPPALGNLVTKYLPALPTDPKTKQLYSYDPGPGRKTYSLAAYLEEPNAGVYSVTGP